MASPIFISNPPPGFSITAILRGFQLAFLGAYRSLQNPKLFKTKYYRQAGLAIVVSVLLQVVVWSPIVLLRIFAKFVGLFFKLDGVNAFATTLKNLQFDVLNISVFVVAASRFFTNDLDHLFLASLEFIDSVYLQKHPDRTSHQYHSNLVALSDGEKSTGLSLSLIHAKYISSGEFAGFVRHHFRNGINNLAVFLLSKVPVVGSIVIGVISFLALNDKIGTVRALSVFAALQVVPKYYAMLLLGTYWGSRNMVHDLLLPYFSRVKFTTLEKNQWLKSREGLLFGFGLCFFTLIKKFPWTGLLIFGFAESSVAYLITKLSDPPPNQVSQLMHWNASQLVWNKDVELEILLGQYANKDEGFVPVPGSYIFS